MGTNSPTEPLGWDVTAWDGVSALCQHASGFNDQSLHDYMEMMIKNAMTSQE